MESIEKMIDRAMKLCSSKYHEGTKSDVARDLGVSAQTLYNWATGRRAMPDWAIIDLALKIGMDPRHALGEYHFERARKKSGLVRAGIAVAVCLLAAGTIALTGDDVLGPPSGEWSQQATHYAQAFFWVLLVATTLLHFNRDARRWAGGGVQKARDGHPPLAR